jgi:hypothetical protein
MRKTGRELGEKSGGDFEEAVVNTSILEEGL